MAPATPYRIILKDCKRMPFCIIDFNVLKEIERIPETLYTSKARLTDSIILETNTQLMTNVRATHKKLAKWFSSGSFILMSRQVKEVGLFFSRSVDVHVCLESKGHAKNATLQRFKP